MSKVNNNLLVREARGNMAKQFVYRRHGKNTIMTKMPTINENLEATVKQVTVRELFAEAANYAKSAIADPELKADYKKKAKPGRTAYNMAFRDYLNAPVVKAINDAQYTGAIGSRIEVTAKDDFRVASVEVGIYTAGGVLIEKGQAVLNPVNRNKWIYTATQQAQDPASTNIRALALDVPGNKGTLEIRPVIPGV